MSGQDRVITSSANPKVRFLRSLHERKGRRETGCFLVEGIRLVADALTAGATFKLILYNPTTLESSEPGLALLHRIPREVAYAAEEHVVAAASDTATPQGIVAAVERISLRPVEPGLALVADELQDPGNLGTMIRSAAASGAGVVMTTQGTVDVFSPKCVRAGMSAHFRVPIREDQPWAEIQRVLEGRTLFLAVPRDGEPYWAVDWTRPSALIVGSEAAGPSALARTVAGAAVTIPMRAGVESLNAATAASIILFEAFRQRTQHTGTAEELDPPID